ncbi:MULTISPECIES: DUF3888 domain-containing protein [Bacillus]|uniref:DUF3888 domain-containing protein n=6 Tax=Bacillus cereus group TaxID=86661 RepID=A0A9X7AMG6_BACTU|nr:MULTISPECIES: DUF3888 domain-containing protein [Bacillus]PAW39190.1 DUF3888 domain-containing protein [Bacillus toyonensis]AEA18399.1 hypothetical protein CT43_CH4740 [Bacillus thuringiensis serovar chinensis CT-43]AFV20551.1 hypothetical protein BTB_c48720 [Bacillus thuringiensis Bt407]AGG03528.1 hypothetical protein H175_ch4818 [Bacillus thuringiensis serovar thuringiensis str. IS5056]AHA74343.1 hypothetical protein YBT1518_26135 [Bacillus thuringiensis YBT-1518]
MKKICVIITAICSIFFSSPSDSFAKESREQLLESALLNRYYSVIRQVTEDQYECDAVINIKRLGRKDEFVPRFEVTLQFLTFQGAHNPPNDKVTLTLEDYLDHIKVKNVEREKNVSNDVVEKICARKKEKMKAHSND